MPETRPTCSTCRFAEPVMVGDDQTEPRVECRRFPPTVIVISPNEPVTIQTQVHADDWCGEHEPADPDSTSVKAADSGTYSVVSSSVVLYGGGDTYIPLPDGSEVTVSIGPDDGPLVVIAVPMLFDWLRWANQ